MKSGAKLAVQERAMVQHTNTESWSRKNEMQIDYRYYLIFKRLRLRFTIATLERHWDKIVTIVRTYAHKETK